MYRSVQLSAMVRDSPCRIFLAYAKRSSRSYINIYSASVSMARITIASVAALFAVTGCDAYIASSEHQARTQIADYSGWLRAKADSRDEIIREIGTVKVGRLVHGGEAVLPLDVTGAHEAVVIASCDRECTDLDLRIETEDGRLMGLDDDEDDTPRVSIEAGKTNKLQARIRMAHCTGSSCVFALSQFEYEDYRGGTGSCFAVSPDGLLMTSLHVVDKATKITVAFPDGRRGEARVVRTSSDNDLAVLRTDAPTPVWLPLADATDISVGMRAFTVGFPSPDMLGSEVKFTEGSVSSLSGFVDESTLLQVSIPIQRGNSGGPVLSYSGRVLGIIEAAIEEDEEGNPMQLTNFARNARVAALLIPRHGPSPTPPIAGSEKQAVSRALRAVCQVKSM
jgi:S1-C subfamily serine protease